MMVFFEERCTGCRTCEYICSAVKNKGFNPSRSAIRIRKEGVMDRASFCTQCGDCVLVCPPGALSKNNDVVTLDPELCTGCELCIETCMVDGIFVDQTSGKAVKCDSCGECIRFCSARALEG